MAVQASGKGSPDSVAGDTGQQESAAAAIERLRDDQQRADREQALADGEQTRSDSEQTAADTDEAMASKDQAASVVDQRTSDRDLESGGDRGLHDLMRDARTPTRASAVRPSHDVPVRPLVVTRTVTGATGRRPRVMRRVPSATTSSRRTQAPSSTLGAERSCSAQPRTAGVPPLTAPLRLTVAPWRLMDGVR